MSQSRFDFARRNAYYGYLATGVAIVLGFIGRTIFIERLGSAYLGFDALLINVLGVLSFLELGIGAAMSYSLYKPVADKDIESVRALMRFYRVVYRAIALAVTCVGLALIPLIPKLAQGAENLGDLRVYYVLFLASNVISYFAVYKSSVANAEQRRYLVTNIHTVASVVVQLSQILLLVSGGSYMTYLVAMLVGRAAEQLYLNWYLSKRYGEYLEAPANPVSPEQLRPIKQNIRALVWHKIGEIGVNQSDAIIIAAFINVTILGIVANYNLVLNAVTLFLTVTLTAALGSFGNAIATTSPETVYRNYKAYRLAAFWLYGVATIGAYVLLSPMISLWLGDELVLPETVILLIMLNFCMAGQRLTMITVKTAAGIWAEDRYLPIAQTLINLVVSIILVRAIGLAGVYIGTLAQGLVATVVRPVVVYPRVFLAPWLDYFRDGAVYTAVLIVTAGVPALVVRADWLVLDSWARFILAGVAVTIWTNAAFALLLGRRPETRELRRRLNVFPPRS